MTENELKKLKRIELLELMVAQGHEIEELKAVIKKQEAQLADRAIKIEKAGTIAEASFALNGVLEAAEATAKQYLDNIAALNESQERICQEKIRDTEEKCIAMEQATKEKCTTMEQTTKEKVEALKEETKLSCEQQIKAADDYYAEKVLKAEADSEKRWEELKVRLENFYNAHKGLREILGVDGEVTR